MGDSRNEDQLMKGNEKAISDLASELYGASELDRIGLKLGEESGEVQGAIMRFIEGRETNLNKIADEIGDTLFVLNQLCHRIGVSMNDCEQMAIQKNLAKLPITKDDCDKCEGTGKIRVSDTDFDRCRSCS